MKDAHLLLGVTGSIAAFKSADLTARLVENGAEVTVIMTEAARRFVAPLTFETLSRRPVLVSMWDRIQYPEPVHVEVGAWADLFIIAPASANILGKMANGIADDILSCMNLTVARPPLIAPAMNDAMYCHPAVQRNIEILGHRGCEFVGPVKGRLSNGKIGMGRMADIEDILKAVRNTLKKTEKAG